MYRNLLKVAQKIEEKLNMDKNNPTIVCNSFVKRQTKSSKFSHFDGSWEELEQLTKDNFAKATPGYKPGVLLVPVPADRFKSGVVEINPETQFHVAYAPRREGEDPYLQIAAKGGNKSQAKYVNIVLYSHDVLAENNENDTDADYEIISINARPTEGEEPLPPITMARNMAGLVGGTKASYTAEQFVESILYWNKRAMIHQD